ncbi:MAG: DUF4293 domain-containing protein [Saprospiraceae bacterium]
MIQRIQSIFLIMTGIVFGLLFTLPLATSSKPSVQFLSDSVFDITDHPALIGLTILGILVALVSVFMFRKRQAQLKLGYLLIIVAILLPVISFVLFTNASAEVDQSVQVYDQAGMYLPLASIVFAALANYFIRKDEKLVKSMDRLR